MLNFWKVGRLRVPVTPPSKGNSKSFPQRFLYLNPSKRWSRKNLLSLFYFVRGIDQILPKWLFDRGYIRGGQSPSTPQPTLRLWPTVLLDDISQLNCVHRSRLAFVSFTPGRREFWKKNYKKFGKVWEAISPKWGRNSKFCSTIF